MAFENLSPFTRSLRGPALKDGTGGTSERPSAKTADPGIRNIGHVTKEISLADDAEYDLSDVVVGKFEARWTVDQTPNRGRFHVLAKSGIATSALQRSSTTLTATVASGAAEGLQPGQWIRIADSSIDDYNGVHQVVTTTATTITFTVADSGSTSDAGVATVEPEFAVFAEAGEQVVLWDSIIAADNQDQNLGALRRGIYTVISDGFHETLYSNGTALLQYAQNVTAAGPLDVTHDEVDDATSDTLTALFVSSGDVLLRNGADVATALTVLFQPMEHVGLDQDGLVCFYSKRDDNDTPPSLRLKNRLGSTAEFELARIA